MSECLDGRALATIASATECIAITDNLALMELEAGLLTLAEDVGGVLGHLGGEGEGSNEGNEDAKGKKLHSDLVDLCLRS